MPPSRSYKRKRSFRRRGGYKKRRMIMAPRRYGGIFGLKKFNRSKTEKKFLDTLLNSNLTSTSVWLNVNGPIAGTGYNQRIGRKIRIFSWQMNLFVQVGATQPSRCRILVVIDRQANKVAPTNVADLLDTSVVTSPSQSFMNLDNRARFQILYDKKFSLDSTTIVTRNFNVYRNKIFDVTFADVGAGATSIATNAMYVVQLSDQAASMPVSVGGFRVRYTDA